MAVYGAVSRERADPAKLSALEESELVERIRARDLGAFEELYRNYQPRLSRFLINLVRRPQLVEEVLNDTMMVVWDTADRFQGASKLSTWIFAIAYRKALKARCAMGRTGRGQGGVRRVSPEAGPDAAAPPPAIAGGVIGSDEPALRRPSGGRRPDLFSRDGLREIAEVMHCPVDTVKTRMFHARRRLRQVLAGELGDWL